MAWTPSLFQRSRRLAPGRTFWIYSMSTRSQGHSVFTSRYPAPAVANRLPPIANAVSILSSRVLNGSMIRHKRDALQAHILVTVDKDKPVQETSISSSNAGKYLIFIAYIMFKIESYLTPLLMGYLDKYVKLRPDDFQLSLWGGDAVLYNLDLRLDIIEKAIQLPIVFQSGHIHELRLHVPWTKLGSDPVVITINTIECILKVRDTAYRESSPKAGATTPGKPSQKLRARKQDSQDLPPGYLQSLMNKIVNNVNIIINNLIIKFVEDDIVLSLNVKSAEIYSANKNWERAFVELTAPDFVLRRAINFIDLTVCLDKRDASGKIETYQDPMAYRCSIACRLYSKFENLHAKFPLETKFNIYCERVDISLTDTQLPMVIRLVELAMALYYGTFQFRNQSVEEEPQQQDVLRESKSDTSVGEPPPEEGDPGSQSWTSWAWSYVPQILPEEGEEATPSPRRKQTPALFSFGMFAFKLTVKFKLTEYLKEKAHYGPRKVVFRPFLYLEAEGLALDTLMQGLNFFNSQIGITNLAVYSQGVCICGAEGEENARNHLLLSGGDNLATKTSSNYICQSLFDAQSPENLGIPISKILDFDEHRQVCTEQYGSQKFGVFWMDYVYGMDKSREPSDESSRSSVSSKDEGHVFEKEKSLNRYVVGPCNLNISSTTVHRVQKFLDAAYKYEYEPYSKTEEERVDSSRPHPTEDQLASLEENIPVRTTHLAILQPTVSFLAAEHPYCDVAKKTYRSHQQKPRPGQQPPVLSPLFGIQCGSSRFDLQTTSPMWPRHLVKLVSKIAGPPANLVHHCHSHTQLKLFGFHVGVVKVDSAGTRSPLISLVPPTSGAMYTRRLILPMYWSNIYLPKIEKMYELPQVSVRVSKPALHVIMAIVSSWKQNNPKPADIMASSLLEDLFPESEASPNNEYPELEVRLVGLEVKTCRTEVITATSGNVGSLHVLVHKQGQQTVRAGLPVFSCPSDTEHLHTTEWLMGENSSSENGENTDGLTFTYQLPRKYNQVQAPAVVLLNMEGTACSLDPGLLDWLSYNPRVKVSRHEHKVELNLELAKAASPLQTNMSQVSVPSSGSKQQTSMNLTRSQTTGAQSTLPATKPDDSQARKQGPSSVGERLAEMFPLIRVLQVQVDIKKICVFIPRHHVDLHDPSVCIVENYRQLSRSQLLGDTGVLCLPRVTVQSAGLKTMAFVQDLPITTVDGSLIGDKIPWNVNLQNFCLYTLHAHTTIGNRSELPLRAFKLVKPATVTSTVGVSYKYNPPTSDNISSLGLCLHTDMKFVTVATSFEQLKLVMDVASQSQKIVTKTLSFLDGVSKSMTAEKVEKEKPPFGLQQTTSSSNLLHSTNQTISAASVTENDQTTSGDLASIDTTASRDLEIIDTPTEGVKLSLWLQWTLPKCELKMFINGKKEECLVVALLEDITLSVDVQDVYSKLKLNLGATTLSHKYRNSTKEDWKAGSHGGILMSSKGSLSHDTHIITPRSWSSDHHHGNMGQGGAPMYPSNPASREAGHGFLNVTFTHALRRNLKQRLKKMNIEVPTCEPNENGDLFGKFFYHKYVSELCVTVGPCDIILCMDPVSALMYSLTALHTKKVKTETPKVESSPNEETPLPLLTSSNLPLIYADVSCARLFLPGLDCEQVSKEQIVTTRNHDMFLLEVQSLTMTPHADNPLPRYPVDRDLYHQAVQAGVTQDSGAALTDRQYQVDVKGFSLSSGCWGEFTSRLQESVTQPAMTTGTQIPAVEWNTRNVRSSIEEITLFPIVSPCELRLVLAPAMVNLQPSAYNTLLKNLVCGYGFEFNVVSDLELYVSTNQLLLMNQKVKDIMKSVMPDTDFHGANSEEKDSIHDSGIGSEVSNTTMQKNKNQSKDQRSSADRSMTLTPIDLLLTAGRISIQVYTHEMTEKEIKINKSKFHQDQRQEKKSKQDLEWKVEPVSRSELDNDEGHRESDGSFHEPYLMHMYEHEREKEGRVIEAGTVCIRPFLFVYVSQPHTVVALQKEHQKFETSSYDVLIKGADPSNLICVSESKLLPDCSDYPVYWLETRAGKPSPQTGIPPSLYTLGMADFLHNPVFPARPAGNQATKQTQGTEAETAGPTQELDLFRQVNTISVQTEQVVVSMETRSCEEQPEVTTALSNLQVQVGFTHGEAGEVTGMVMNSYLRDFLVKTSYNQQQLYLLGPCSLKADGTYTLITHDNTHFLSQCMLTMATGMVTMHIGQEHVLCLMMIADHMAQFSKELFPKAEKLSPPEDSTFEADLQERPDRVMSTQEFVVHSSTDDLRKGLDLVPSVGEIVFCNLDKEGNSSMTWSYNIPRVVSALSSTPVPFNADETTDEGNTVLCRLQYWEGLIQQFMDYGEMRLSENDVSNMAVPEVRHADTQDIVAAQIWRIVIKNEDRPALVIPASLAASVHVDSCFVPSLIPSLQLGVTLEALYVHASNHPTGEFAVVSFDDVLVAAHQWAGPQGKTQIQFSSEGCMDVLEYRCLTMDRVISPVEFSGTATIQTHNKVGVYDLDLTVDPLTLSVGQGTIHSLTCAAQAWKQIIKADRSGEDSVIFSHYVICNDTQHALRFGQVGTDENLVLQPREMHQYSWRSQKELHMCVDGSVWKWCGPVSLDRPVTLVRSVISTDHTYTLVVISGLLTVSNRLSHHCEVKVVATEMNKEVEHQAVAGAQLTVPSYILEPRTIQGIRIRPWGSSGPWSNVVSVFGQNRKDNTLVKLTNGERTYHVWCRVIPHTFQNIQQVVICPLYTVRSHLPQPLYVNVDTVKLGLHEQVPAPGKGFSTQLRCPGGDLHQALTFQFSGKSGKSSSSVTLSTGLIDQLQRAPEGTFDPATLTSYTRDQSWQSWPYIQELNTEDVCMPESQNTVISEMAMENQPTIDLNVSLGELWAGYRTVLVDVAPSYLITNGCDIDLVFMGTEDIQYDIHKGQTICPPKLENCFHLGARLGGSVHISEPIPVSEEELLSQRYRTDVGRTLYIDSWVHMPIFAHVNGSVLVTVKHSISSIVQSHSSCDRKQSDLHPITFQPLLLVQNSNKKADIDHKTDIVKYVSVGYLPKDKSNKTTSYSNEENSAVQEAFSDWSFPVRLLSSDGGRRMTLTVVVRDGEIVTYRALCVSGVEEQGMTYLSVQVDKAPACLLENQCSFPLFFGQTLMNLSLKGATIQEETELIAALPLIPVGGSTYYTPPLLNTQFPQLIDKRAIPKVHIAGMLPNNRDHSDLNILKWSHSIDLHIAADNFISLPGVADVKVHVQQVAMVTIVSIAPVTKADVSAKEIRSRLTGKERTITVSNQSEIKDMNTESSLVSNKANKMMSEKALRQKKKRKTKKSARVSLGVLATNVTFVLLDETSVLAVKQEMIRLTLNDLYVATYPASDLAEQPGYHRNCVVVSCGDIQLDNQMDYMDNFDFPVVFVRQEFERPPSGRNVVQLSQMNVLEKHAVLKSTSLMHVQMVFGSVEGRNSVIETVECSIEPVNIYIDDTFIFQCIKQVGKLLPVPLTLKEPVPVNVYKVSRNVRVISQALSCPVVIGHLAIQPVSMLCSIHASMKVFIAADQTPLKFGRFEKLGVCTTSYQLTKALAMHYASGALFRAGAVVGSLEILGNPTGLVRSIGTGVADFFRMPYRGLTRGPGAFVVGVSQGTSSMVKNVTTGMLKSVTNFASSVSRNMDRLSLDGSHMRRQEEGRRHRPDGVGEGLKQGLTGLGISVLGAIAGLADQPIQSLLQMEGVAGGHQGSAASNLVTGMGKGLMGVFTKPIGGAAEFVSQTGQGILQGTGLSRLPHRQCAPVGLKLENATSGQVKYALKLLQTLPSSDILCCMQAVYIDLTDSEVSVTLILTPEILFVMSHEDDSQQQSFSLTELECGVTLGDDPTLSLVWRDANTFTEQQKELTNAERVTAFIDGTTKYMDRLLKSPIDSGAPKLAAEIQDQEPLAVTASEALQGAEYQMEGGFHGEPSCSLTEGRQCSDTQSDSSVDQVESNLASLPQYDFKISATKMAAFLAVFNITKHKLEGTGFPKKNVTNMKL
ncbi:VP13B-like protein [Mya arenaria]|uniref:VP13B-like protein n=1 Tax=Mya arenaria TaxID=6604 RepID=A0ABY7DRK5_MYAAR|nr:VP13B-like protein [Mya arenaria]